MVFQYPEYQLFDETVAKDVSFGPKNLGLKPDEIDTRVREAIETVGLSYDAIADRSPFELSGGQKRRIAIAGVIAMRPEILVLDEPTAGLDPVGRLEMFDLIKTLKKTTVKTVIMVSHNMDEIAELASKIAVLYNGRLEFLLPPAELFGKHSERLAEIGLDIPESVKIANGLRARGLEISGEVETPKKLVESILAARRERL
jgi:ABC-type cobalt transport system, ATPase component